jgi:hypothetical protein
LLIAPGLAPTLIGAVLAVPVLMSQLAGRRKARAAPAAA